MLQAGYFSMAHLEPIYIKSEFSFVHFFFLISDWNIKSEYLFYFYQCIQFLAN